MYVCVLVCTCMQAHLCMWLYRSVCVCTCLYVYVHICLYMCVCTFMYVNVCMCVHVCVCTLMCVYVCTCVFILIYHYTKVIVVRLCVCPSVTGGHRKRFDPEKQEAVSLAIEQQKLELGNLCDRHPWH